MPTDNPATPEVKRCKTCGSGDRALIGPRMFGGGCPDSFHPSPTPAEVQVERCPTCDYTRAETAPDVNPTLCPDPFHTTPAEAQPVEQGERASWEAQRRCGECGTLVEVPAQPCHDAIHLQSQIEELTRERDTALAELDNERIYTTEYRGGAQAYRRQAEAAQSQIEELKALAYVPNECACGGGDHESGAMAGPKPRGPDCRPLTWKEKAEQAKQNAIDRRNEAREALSRIEELRREREEYAATLCEVEAVLGDVHPELWTERTADWLRRALRAREARAETAQSLITETVKWCEGKADAVDGIADGRFPIADRLDHARAQTLRSCAAKLKRED